MIYFMQDLNSGPVKIGFSDNVRKRQRELKAYYKRPLVVLAAIPGDKRREREIHKKFSRFRFGQTEQFQPVLDIFDFIGQPLLVSANPDAVEAMETARQVVAFRCTEPYKVHLETIAEEETRTPTQVIERALDAYAKAGGYKPFPKR